MKKTVKLLESKVEGLRKQCKQITAQENTAKLRIHEHLNLLKQKNLLNEEYVEIMSIHNYNEADLLVNVHSIHSF